MSDRQATRRRLVLAPLTALAASARPDRCAASGAEMLLLEWDGITSSTSSRTIELAAGHRIACIGAPFIAHRGGVAGYGSDLTSMFRTAAGHVDKLLRGARAGNLPIEQATKNVLVVNLKAVKALRLPLPAALLTWADEVIE